MIRLTSWRRRGIQLTAEAYALQYDAQLRAVRRRKAAKQAKQLARAAKA